MKPNGLQVLDEGVTSGYVSRKVKEMLDVRQRLFAQVLVIFSSHRFFVPSLRSQAMTQEVVNLELTQPASKK